MTALAKVRVLRALGWRSVGRVARYRLGLRLRTASVLRLSGDAPDGPIFPPRQMPPAPARVPALWRHHGLLFGHHRIAVGDQPPDFAAHPLHGESWPGADMPWWQLGDFGEHDIKLVWELSRFPWLVPMAQQARAGDANAHDRLNEWLAAWIADNSPYRGPNWKCGQEASLRVLVLALASAILCQDDAPSDALMALVRLHLARIAPTIGYALGQDNNHGTSEAAALFVGGSWLARCGVPQGKRWAALGRRWLEERALALIAQDGSFSQHSVVYHRLMIDTYAAAEWWRRKLELRPWSSPVVSRLRAAADWLYQMTDPATGDAPNLGANDGARLIMLSDADYRDFRPSVERAMVLFHGKRAYLNAATAGDELVWLGLSADGVAAPPGSAQYDVGGYAMLRAGIARALLRYPRFRFRPSQADALHLDIWIGARNVVRDAGTYSYHARPDPVAYFGGTAGHSTIAFDERDQMPRLSRFLFGDWLQTDRLEPLRRKGDGWTFGAGYRDHLGARHFRRVTLLPGQIVIEDEVSGFERDACLRWRLDPKQWRTLNDGNGVTDGNVTLRVVSDAVDAPGTIEIGRESLYYAEQHNIPVFEVSIARAGRVLTTIEWSA